MNPTLLREARPTARKAHRCSLCTGRIQPGEKYHRDTLTHDGRIYDWLTCGPCRDDGIIGLVWDWADDDDADIGPNDAFWWATGAAEHPGGPVEMVAATTFLKRWRGDS